ncbi:MAG: hypothetical protein KDD69_02555 [Bdellovibrionales bacterium]|nr:hypothetical protein [Bdellovibrionales bacterium]
MADVKLGRGRSRKERSGEGDEAELQGVGLPNVPQNNQLLVNGNGQVQAMSQPLVVAGSADGSAHAARLEQVDRMLDQNPHLRILYQGPVPIERMSEQQLRELEERFAKRTTAPEPQPAMPAPTLTQSAAFTPSASPALGAEGALVPQGVERPMGLMTSIGMTGPQGLLAPRSDSPPQAQPARFPQMDAARERPATAPSETPQATQTASYNGLLYDAGQHFAPTDMSGSYFPSQRSGKSPFAEMLSRLLGVIASLFGLGGSGGMLYHGSSGEGPVIRGGPKRK